MFSSLILWYKGASIITPLENLRFVDKKENSVLVDFHGHGKSKLSNDFIYLFIFWPEKRLAYLKTEDETKSVQLIYVGLALISIFFFFAFKSIFIYIYIVNSLVLCICEFYFICVYFMRNAIFYFYSSYIIIQCIFMCYNKKCFYMCFLIDKLKKEIDFFFFLVLKLSIESCRKAFGKQIEQSLCQCKYFSFSGCLHD